MYQVISGNNVIAKTALEVGDPPMGCVSGLLLEIGNIKDFSKKLLELGAEENEHEIRLELDECLYLENTEKVKMEYSGGCILCYPTLDEVLIDVVGIPYPQYQQLFPKHVKDYEELHKDT